MSFFARRRAFLPAWLRRLWWEEEWCVGLIDDESFWHCASIGVLDDSRVRWFQPAGKFFIADPCWFLENDQLFAAECFDYRRRIGRLVLAKLEAGKAFPARTIKEDGVHHSYPMVYKSGEGFLIVPESAECETVKAISMDASGIITGEASILSGRKLVDPTIFSRSGSYWLFANPLHNFDHELVALRSKSILGPWEEAAFSPLSIANSRGAGKIFEMNGHLYWPTQYNSVRYGGGVILRRILSLSSEALEHDIASIILPDSAGSRPLGFHSFSRGDRHHLVDGLRYAFSPLKPLNVLMSRVGRRIGRSRG